MATILRKWSYQFPELYNAVSFLVAIPVGGRKRFHFLPLQDIEIEQQSRVLDLCCGGGQATKYLVGLSSQVVGLDISPKALERATRLVPTASYVEGLAETLPFAQESFDIVHTSVALHEMELEQLQKIFAEVYRVLSPNGQFIFLDLSRPANPLVWSALALFMFLFETETAWKLVNIDLRSLLKLVGFREIKQKFYGAGSLQVIQCRK